MNIAKLALGLLIVFLFVGVFIFPEETYAQDFAGSNVGNYYCANYDNLDHVSADELSGGGSAGWLSSLLKRSTLVNVIGSGYKIREDRNGNAVIIDNSSNYVCVYSDNSRGGEFVIKNAIPKPPTLRQVQVWFVRIIYVIWAISGFVFTAALVWIGFKYLTSFGNDYAVGGVIKDFRKWLVGLALVFLSYPALNTFFNILPISESACFADVNMVGFQFFFPEACN